MKAHLELEELGTRTLPSTMSLATVAGTTRAATAHPVHLNGTVTGSYVGNTLMVDAGTFDKLTGTAQLVGLGTLSVTGSIQGLGLIASGRATGSLTFSGPSGTITLVLLGPVQQAFAPLPTTFAYGVTGGTGAYQHFSAAGAVTLKLSPAPTAFGLPPRGLFTLSFA